MSISIATLKEAIDIKESILRLEARLSRILGGNAAPEEITTPRRGRPGRRKMSASARARISAAMKARWAARGATKIAAPKKGPGRHRNLSPEGRARIVAALKARWAKQKGQKTAAPAKKRKKAGNLSPEGRAKIVAALKRRWAAYNKGAK